MRSSSLNRCWVPPSHRRNASAGNEDGTERDAVDSNVTSYGRAPSSIDDQTEKIYALDGGRADRCEASGIEIVGPPMFALLDLNNGHIVPSQYAKDAKAAGLDIITWTLERSGILADGNNGFSYQTIDSAITREGDVMKVLDVLARDVGIRGIFSDWAATVTYYANCMGIE